MRDEMREINFGVNKNDSAPLDIYDLIKKSTFFLYSIESSSFVSFPVLYLDDIWSVFIHNFALSCRS